MPIRFASPKGRLIGWKRAYRKHVPVLVKLHIPSHADVICGADDREVHKNRRGIRVASIRRATKKDKRRASEAKVIAVFAIKDTPTSFKTFQGRRMKRPGRVVSQRVFEYRIGKTVKPDNGFDDNTWQTCSAGIHFFLDKQAALDY